MIRILLAALLMLSGSSLSAFQADSPECLADSALRADLTKSRQFDSLWVLDSIAIECAEAHYQPDDPKRAFVYWSAATPAFELRQKEAFRERMDASRQVMDLLGVRSPISRLHWMIGFGSHVDHWGDSTDHRRAIGMIDSMLELAFDTSIASDRAAGQNLLTLGRIIIRYRQDVPLAVTLMARAVAEMNRQTARGMIGAFFSPSEHGPRWIASYLEEYGYLFYSLLHDPVRTARAYRFAAGVRVGLLTVDSASVANLFNLPVEASLLVTGSDSIPGDAGLERCIDSFITAVNPDEIELRRIELDRLWRGIARLGNHYQEFARYEDAERLHRQVYRLRALLYGEQSAEAAGSLNNIANTFLARERFAEAASWYTQALAMIVPVRGDTSDIALRIMGNLADAQVRLGMSREPEQLYRHRLTCRAGHLNRSLEGLAHHDLARMYHAQGRLIEAEQQYRQSMLILDSIIDLLPHTRAEPHRDLAELLLLRARPVEAEPEATRALLE